MRTHVTVHACVLCSCLQIKSRHGLCNILTQACLLLQLAFKIYDQLQGSGLELTLHSYHTVLKGSRHLQATGLQSLYAQMIADRNVVLKDKTFGYVFRAAATCGEGLPASWLIQVCQSFYRQCTFFCPLYD